METREKLEGMGEHWRENCWTGFANPHPPKRMKWNKKTLKVLGGDWGLGACPIPIIFVRVRVPFLREMWWGAQWLVGGRPVRSVLAGPSPLHQSMIRAQGPNHRCCLPVDLPSVACPSPSYPPGVPATHLCYHVGLSTLTQGGTSYAAGPANGKGLGGIRGGLFLHGFRIKCLGNLWGNRFLKGFLLQKQAERTVLVQLDCPVG